MGGAGALAGAASRREPRRRTAPGAAARRWPIPARERGPRSRRRASGRPRPASRRRAPAAAWRRRPRGGRCGARSPTTPERGGAEGGRRGGRLRPARDDLRRRRRRGDRARRDRGARSRRRATVRGVVDLDGPGGDDGRGGEPGGRLGSDGADAGRERTAGAGRARRGAGRGRDRAARAGRRAQVGEHELLEQQQRPDGQHRRERLVRLLELLAEARAALAGAQVPAHRRRRPPQALGHLSELVADLLATEVARLGRLGERDARAHEQRLHRGTVVSIASEICS